MNLPYLLAHFIGDFLFQNDWMAQNKKKKGVSGLLACLYHVLMYMMPFFLCGMTPLQLLLIAAQHFIQDRTSFVALYCNKFSIFQSELNQGGVPWGHVVVDQVFHILWMWAVVNNVHVEFIELLPFN